MELVITDNQSCRMSNENASPAVIVLPENNNLEDVHEDPSNVDSPLETVVSNESLDFSTVSQ